MPVTRTPHRLDIVARAICKGRGLVFDSMDDAHRREWLLDARNALRAILEPTDAMIRRGHECDFFVQTDQMLENTWRMMLGELLS